MATATTYRTDTGALGTHTGYQASTARHYAAKALATAARLRAEGHLGLARLEVAWARHWRSTSILACYVPTLP